jgi:ferritin
MKSLLSKEDKKKLDLSAQQELTAQNMYRYLHNCMQSKGYFGAADFFKKEAKDEGKHYDEIVEFVNSRGDETEVLAIPAQDLEGDGIKDAFGHAFDAEVSLGEFYEDFYNATNDITVKQFLLSFIERQRVSVGEYFDLLSTLERCGNNEAAILLFDQSLLK